MTNTPETFLSFIVPVHGAAPGLEACLESLRGLQEKSWEALLVCDGPQALARAQQAAGLAQGPWRLVGQPDQGPGAARSLGVAQARGEVVLFLPPQCALPPHLAGKLGELMATGLAGVGLSAYPQLGSEPLARLAGLELDWEQESSGLPLAGCAAFSRRELLAAGGLDPALGSAALEVLDLWLRLQAQGRPLAWDPAAYVWASQPESWPALLKQAMAQGRERFARLRLSRRLPPGLLRQQAGPPAQTALALLCPALLIGLWPQAPDRALSLALLCLLLLYPLNRPFLRFLAEQGPDLLSQALLYCWLRPFAWLAGMLGAALGRLGGG